MQQFNSRKRLILQKLNDYLQCVIFNTPEELPLAEHVRATYNGVETAVGANEIWEKAVRFESRQSFADDVTNSAMFFGTATSEAVMVSVSREDPKNKPGSESNLRADEYNRGTSEWWYYVLRLTLEGDRIAEIEEITVAEHLVHFPCPARDYPLHIDLYDMPLAESERCSREEMIRVADTYWQGIEKQIAWNEVLVHPDAQRIEMGVLCTNASRNYHTVQSNFRSPKFLWKMENKRWYIVDEEKGVVACMVIFKQIKNDTPPGFIAAELFKIQNGLIRDIRATFKPRFDVSGWEGHDVTGL